MAPSPASCTETAATLPSRYSYQIWSAQGQLLLRSVQAPVRRLAPPGFTGFRTIRFDGRELDVFALNSKSGDMTVIVADGEDEGVFAAVFGGHLALFMAVLLPAVLGGTWWMLRHALAPLVRTSREVRLRRPSGLAPLPLDGAPAELRAIIDAVNRLMRKVDDAVAGARVHCAGRAKLRTPLASLRGRAQVLARSRDRPEQRQELAALEVNVVAARACSTRCSRWPCRRVAARRAAA
ncbi:MAG: hypothetical protein U1F49_01145 [Rubrivivax sp.]